jgi:uncharacterized protein
MNKANIKPNIPELIVEALKNALGEKLVAVVLFGSRARGEAAMESDWDFLIIAHDLPSGTLRRHMLLKKALPAGCRGAVAILAKTPEEFESHIASLYLDIALDGKILYDPSDYAHARLSTLRVKIEKAGLKRQHTSAGFLWQWEKEPLTFWSLRWAE